MRNGLIVVLHRDGIERDARHFAIGLILLHGHTITHPQHIVGAYLNTGHKPHDGILENEQQHSRHSTKGTEHNERRLVEQRGEDENTRQNVDHQLSYLNVA